MIGQAFDILERDVAVSNAEAARLRDSLDALSGELAAARGDAEAAKQALAAAADTMHGDDDGATDVVALEAALKDKTDALEIAEAALKDKNGALEIAEAALKDKTDALEIAEAALKDKTDALEVAVTTNEAGSGDDAVMAELEARLRTEEAALAALEQGHREATAELEAAAIADVSVL